MKARDSLRRAIELHQSGHFEAASAAYREILRHDPDFVDALHLLALADRSCGRLGLAQQRLQRVLGLRPGFAEAHGNYGLVLADLGQTTDAEAAYRRALALAPALAEVWSNLGNLLLGAGQAEDARGCFAEALARKPLPDAHLGMAEAHWALGDIESAIAEFTRALDIQPQAPAVWHRLGACHRALGQATDALRCFLRAVEQAPDLAEAHNDLGTTFNGLGRPVEAAACFERALAENPELIESWNNLGNVLRQLGKPQEAERCFRKALSIKVDFAEAELNLGIVLQARNATDEAMFFYRQALIHRPDLVQAHNNLGVLFTERGRHAEAIAEFAAALQQQPDFPEAWNNLGNVYKNAGDLEPAMEAFARAVELRPDYSGAHSNFLFTLNFIDGLDPAQLAQAHRDWGARHGNPPHVYTHVRRPAESGRRLKIAYVSPDFRAHACAFFIEPLLREHHREVVEVYAYAEIAQPDAVTAGLQSLVDVWRNTTGLPDEQVAAAIHADGIDVLIDLAGHSANNRLRALAFKPAPVQVTYLGYPATTGLAAIDWRLTDGVAEPAGQSERYYTERLHRLPHSLWCYQPAADMQPLPGPLPALARGHVSFGSFNNYTKVGPRVVALWAAVLNAVPDAHITLITVPAGEAQETLWQRFEALGVARARVRLLDRLPRAAYVALFDEIDIALDPFPCNGGTTTCDAVWMGLPVVALQGQTFLSRASLSVLTAAGYRRFAAADEADYVARCVSLAADLPALAALRAGLRPTVAASPLLDAAGFAHDVEEAYRALWREWCEGGEPST